MTVAIATNTLGARSETFVTRHVDSLNGGRTIVVCRRIESGSTKEKPILMIGDRGAGLLKRGQGLLHALWNQVYQGGIAIPSADMDRSIARFLRDNEASCIVAEFGPMGCIMERAAALAQVPLYVYFRGRDATSLLRKPGVIRAYRRLFPRVAGVIAVSAFLLENLRAHGFTHHNAHVIPSGVNPDLFAPAVKDPYQMLYVGRFVPKKSPDLVVRAFSSIAEHRSVRLEMIGDGPLLETCKRLAHDLGVADRIEFRGAQPHEYVRQRMATAAILLQHSVTDALGDTEGLPSVIQEAMAAGAVVVATRHAGIPEAIESGVNGVLVEERDLEAFVHAAVRLLDDPVLTGAIARKARTEAIERFDSRRLISQLESILGLASDVAQGGAEPRG